MSLATDPDDINRDPRMDIDHDRKILRKHAVMLHEHFDSVSIIVTRCHNDKGTVCIDDGAGDWFARFGAAKWWIKKHEDGPANEAGT